jgi:16S rRNA (guanine966-N2)-methyltransferase
LVKANVAKMRSGDEVRVLRQDATRLGPNPGTPFDLIFLDPPYGRGLGESALAGAVKGGWLVPGATVVWEEGMPPVIPAGFGTLEQRRYGDTLVTLLRAPDQPAGADGVS